MPNFEQYSYEGFTIAHYLIGRRHSKSEYRFDVYDDHGIRFSLLEAMDDLVLIQADSQGRDELSGRPISEVLFERGNDRVRRIIDSGEYQALDREHVFQHTQSV
jgi:hypothetical protein